MTHLRRITVQGTQDNGDEVPIAATGEGHLEVAIHDPRLPFGSLHTERLRSEFQVDAVYGIPAGACTTTTGHAVTAGAANTGSVTGTSNKFTCATGTTQFSFATLQSRKRLRYRPGQGVVGRFAGGFSAPAASSILVIGFGGAESGFYFGYNGTTFGILHVTGGVREVRTLTVTTASTSTSNYNVQLNGVTTNVTATNNGSTVKTAYEIAQGTYPGWDAYQVGSTVVFINASAAARSGTYSLAQSGAGTPAAGSFAQTLPGAASTDTWIAQSAWNGDKLDGTGPSGVTLDPSKGNVYEIGIQYLGFGDITFRVEAASGDGNNPDFVTVHTIAYPNTSTSTSITQPSFPFTMEAYSAGSTTNVSCFVGSFAGFIEGEKLLHGPRVSPSANSAAVTTTNNYCLFTVMNPRVFGGRANQAVLNILSFIPAHDDTTPIVYKLIRNATLAGTPNFAVYSSDVPLLLDTAATQATTTRASQVFHTQWVAASSSVPFHFSENQDLTIQPGETVTVTATTTAGTSATTAASLNIRADL